MKKRIGSSEVLLLFFILFLVLAVGFIICACGEDDLVRSKIIAGDIVVAEKTAKTYLIREISPEVLKQKKDGKTKVVEKAQYGIQPYPLDDKNNFVIPLNKFDGKLFIIGNIDKDKADFITDKDKNRVHDGDVVLLGKAGEIFKVVARDKRLEKEFFIVPIGKDDYYEGAIPLNSINDSVILVQQTK